MMDSICKCQRADRDERDCVCSEVDKPTSYVVILGDLGASIVAAVQAHSSEQALERTYIKADRYWPDLKAAAWTSKTSTRANKHGAITASVWRNARQYRDNIYHDRGF